MFIKINTQNTRLKGNHFISSYMKAITLDNSYLEEFIKIKFTTKIKQEM